MEREDFFSVPVILYDGGMPHWDVTAWMVGYGGAFFVSFLPAWIGWIIIKILWWNVNGFLLLCWFGQKTDKGSG